MTNTKPQFAIAELLKAAEIAQINPATLPANASPWTLKGDNRAFAWKTAFRSINPTAAEEAEATPSPEAQRRQRMASREAEAANLRALNGIQGATDA